ELGSWLAMAGRICSDLAVDFDKGEMADAGSGKLSGLAEFGKALRTTGLADVAADVLQGIVDRRKRGDQLMRNRLRKLLDVVFGRRQRDIAILLQDEPRQGADEQNEADTDEADDAAVLP